MRCFALVLLGLALPLVAGCGDDPMPAGVQVRILTSTADGPVQGSLVLMSVDDGAGATYPLESVGGDLYRAVGAQPGRFRVLSDQGWGMLWTGRQGSAAPLLRGGEYPAALVRMGKPRSLYVAIADPSLPSAPVTARWAAEWKPLAGGDAAPFRPADIEIVDQGEGIVSLHFNAAQWTRGTALRAAGFLGDGSVSELLSYTVRDADHHELPRMALVFPAPQARLAVHLVPPTGTAPVADGVPVRVDVGGIPLRAVFEERSYGGSAHFEMLPTLGQGLRISVGPQRPDAHGYLLDQEVWRRRQALFVTPIEAATATRVPLPVGEVPVHEVRARHGTGAVFGRVPVVAAPTGAFALTVPGTQDLLVGYADGTWSHLVVTPAGDTVSGRRERLGERRCRIRGNARGAGPGGTVRFTRVLPVVADLLPERRAEGEGFRAALTPDGAYEIELPPGRYEIQVWSAGGPRGRILKQDFGPGAEARLQLSTR
ncbi:MAG: hypothetical protein P1V36_08615 [Planctomycetota bacterium]|nr:hypothetical protein [Planctomycetota bacterium]